MIPRYTPSLLSGEQLERLFVSREPILNDAVERVRDAAQSGRLAHTLFVGPRGAGKTHLISLVHYRITSLPGYGDQFRVAWLPEDPWGIRTYEGLIRMIDETAEPRQAPLTVVLMENLDQVFDRIGEEGQHQLRARIESQRDLLIVGSATRLTQHLLDQAEPFYGFFHTVSLEPFGVDEAIDMLTHIAEEDHDEAALTRLRENQPLVRRRLAAIAHLAGGQPRIWAQLATGLSMENLDTFVEDLTNRFDDMVPYYQEQLHSLSGNEEAVVVSLIQANHPLTTKAISDMTGISQRSLSTAIRDLRERHWIRLHEGVLTSLADKRCAFYELAEPCLRVALQVKQTRSGEPVPLGVEFVSAWYDRPELEQDFADPQTTSYVRAAREVLDSAIGTMQALLVGYPDYVREERPDTVKTFLTVDDALADLQATGSPEAALMLPFSVIDLVEERLTDHSPAMVRLEILLLAAEAGGTDECVERALSAVSGLRAAELPIGRVLVGCVRVVTNPCDSNLEVLRKACEGLQERSDRDEVINLRWELPF